jgi:hypothetical protein
MNVRPEFSLVFGPYAPIIVVVTLVMACLVVLGGSWTALRLWSVPGGLSAKPWARITAIIVLTVLGVAALVLPFAVAIVAPGLVLPVFLGIFVVIAALPILGNIVLRWRSRHSPKP